MRYLALVLACFLSLTTTLLAVKVSALPHMLVAHKSNETLTTWLGDRTAYSVLRVIARARLRYAMDGLCSGFCTVWLAAPYVCTFEYSEFHFHELDMDISIYLRGALGAWYNEVGRFATAEAPAVLTGTQLIELGVTDCRR